MEGETHFVLLRSLGER